MPLCLLLAEVASDASTKTSSILHRHHRHDLSQCTHTSEPSVQRATYRSLAISLLSDWHPMVRATTPSVSSVRCATTDREIIPRVKSNLRTHFPTSEI